MATKKTETTNRSELLKKIAELRGKLQEVRLNIRAGQEKNTNAHKKFKKELAQLLTKLNTQL
jgi:ribosomal protein L29